MQTKWYEIIVIIIIIVNLGYSSVHSINVSDNSLYGVVPSTTPIWLSQVKCHGNESNLVHCKNRGWGSHDCSHKQDVIVKCSHSLPSSLPLKINLTGGVASNEGRVQIRYNGLWGRVCSQYWDIRDGNVVCKQLGYVRAISTQSLAPVSSETSWMDEVHCVGNERNLWDCMFSGWGHSTLYCNEAYVNCTNTPENYDIRLSSDNPHRGLIEVYYNGYWGKVCNTG